MEQYVKIAIFCYIIVFFIISFATLFIHTLILIKEEKNTKEKNNIKLEKILTVLDEIYMKFILISLFTILISGMAMSIYLMYLKLFII